MIRVDFIDKKVVLDIPDKNIVIMSSREEIVGVETKYVDGRIRGVALKGFKRVHIVRLIFGFDVEQMNVDKTSTPSRNYLILTGRIKRQGQYFISRAVILILIKIYILILILILI